MNILFDINHPADVNFFKNAIHKLQEQNHNIIIIYRDRGRLADILKYELKNFNIVMIGSHKRGFFKKIYFQLVRDFSLIPFFRKNKVNIIVCFGATSAISGWFSRIPYLAFDDDFEYKIPFYHANLFSTRHIYPNFIKYTTKSTVTYKGFKELAYLHPDEFDADPKILSDYGLEANEYVFIREIANVSLNYSEKSSILSSLIERIKAKGLKIVLSIEDKSLKKLFSNSCIILEEPVKDIYSLLYFALFAISSGDTMARESTLLGVPTIYTGGRAMVVHEELVKNKLMYEEYNIQKIEELLDILTIDKKNSNKTTIEHLIKNKWENTTSVIIKCVNKFISQKT